MTEGLLQKRQAEGEKTGELERATEHDMAEDQRLNKNKKGFGESIKGIGRIIGMGLTRERMILLTLGLGLNVESLNNESVGRERSEKRGNIYRGVVSGCGAQWGSFYLRVLRFNMLNMNPYFDPVCVFDSATGFFLSFYCVFRASYR